MKILVLGGDKRYVSLMNELKEDIDCVGFEEEQLNDNICNKTIEKLNLPSYDIVILPILGISKDYEIKTLKESIKIKKDFFTTCKKDCIFYTGIINDTMKTIFNERKLISFLKDKKVNNENDILTIEGVVEDLKDKQINHITILGFGNLGSKLASVFSMYQVTIGTNYEELAFAFPDKFFLTTNKEKMKACFKNSDVVLNTVPKNIITEEMLQEGNSYVLDIASYPYGVEESIAKKYKRYKLYSSIPSKYAPDSAGRILSKKIKRDIGGKI